MKKRFSSAIAAVLMIAACLLSSLSMSGCSDFGFNPVGSWKLTSDKIYIDGQFASDEKPGYLKTEGSKENNYEPVFIYMGDLVYKFGKSGTGIICVDNQEEVLQTQDFTYEYNDNEVILYISDDYSRRNNFDPVEMHYAVKKDKEGNFILQNEDKANYIDDDKSKHDFNEVRILSKI